MKKYLFLFLISISAFNNLFSQDTTIIRGTYWKGAGQIGQVAFLYGFYDGISLGSDLAMSSLEPGSSSFIKGMEGYNAISIIGNVRLMDVQDEISRIYKDTLNLCMSIPHAFWVAVNRLSGQDSIKTQKMFAKYLKEDCYPPTKPSKKKKTNNRNR